MKIRKATKTDLNSIWEIEQRVFNSPWSKDQIEWELVSQPTALNFVAEEGKVLMGYLFSHILQGKAQILNLAVDIAWQHRGFGNQLIQKVLSEHLESLNIFLEVKRSNFPAIKLYIQYGFEEIGIRPAYYEDGEDAILMVKKGKSNGMV